MLLGLFVLIAGALAKTPCVTQTINLNGPYSLPLTALADSQFCTYTFNVPAGQFAYTSVIGQDMLKSGGESVIINDISGYAQIMGASSNGDYRVFNSTLAWPQAFSVNFQSYVNTNMKVQISITLQKNLRGQNVVQTVTTSTDSSSAVLYTVDLKEGQTYNLNSLSSVVNVKTAYAYPETYQLLNNVFAYDNGILVGTLLSDSLKFKSRNVQLYVARPVYGMNHGAILVTDQSNIANLKAHYVTYAPIDREDHSQTHLLNGDGTRAGAVTIISDKDGSSPITVTHLNELDDNTAEFTYVTGGPLNTRARDIKLMTTPVKMIGNMNTFYILKERATIQYSV